MPLPATARLKDDTFVLLLQVSALEALVFRPADGRPTKVQRSAFAEAFSGDLQLMTTRDRIAGQLLDSQALGWGVRRFCTPLTTQRIHFLSESFR